MNEYHVSNLNWMIEELGENHVSEILSAFSCPLNADVEYFLRHKAILFAKNGFSQTHLVFAPVEGKYVLVGYFTLANKYITIAGKHMSQTTKKRIQKFATYDSGLKRYCMATPLIAQLGKNYTNGYDKLISGDDLLHFACQKVQRTQLELGGKFVYLECEDKPKLKDFYGRNGFFVFDSRKLDADERHLDGEYLLQLIKYLKK